MPDGSARIAEGGGTPPRDARPASPFRAARTQARPRESRRAAVGQCQIRIYDLCYFGSLFYTLPDFKSIAIPTKHQIVFKNYIAADAATVVCQL